MSIEIQLEAGPGPDVELIELFKRAVREVKSRDVPDVDLDTSISELGLDSVAVLEVVGFLEDELDLVFPDDQLARLQTLRDLSSMVRQLEAEQR